MQQLLIFPYNGNAIEALDCLDDNYDFIGFVDDDKRKQGKVVYGNPIFSRDAFKRYKDSFVLSVPGSPSSYLENKEIIDGLGIPMTRFVKLIHPKAIISRNCIIGMNTLIMGNCVITSNAKICNHVIILPNTAIHHGSVVKNYTIIGSSVTVSGYTVINENCYIGSGTSVINNVEI